MTLILNSAHALTTDLELHSCSSVRTMYIYIFMLNHSNNVYTFEYRPTFKLIYSNRAYTVPLTTNLGLNACLIMNNMYIHLPTNLGLNLCSIIQTTYTPMNYRPMLNSCSVVQTLRIRLKT